MSRNIDTTLAAEFAKDFEPIVLAKLVFRTSTQFVWTGIGDLVWGGNTYKGVGTLGSISDVSEGSELHADGVTVSLSGIDPVLLADSLEDIQPGNPAKIWIGAMNNGAVVGTPYLFFSGTMDKAPIQITPPNADGDSTATISLALENKMIDHSRPSQRRYTAADQKSNGHPTDSGFNHVEELNDQALIEGR
jgi:hypothetical protein